MYDFSKLVLKNKKELVNLAKEENIRSPYQLNKDELIIRLSNQLCDYHKDLLSLDASEVKDLADEEGVEYINKKQALSELSVLEDTTEEEKLSNVDTEFRKARELAMKNVMQEKRSYHILQSKDQDNLFNIRPMFMGVKDEWKLKLTIIYYD